MPGLYIHVPFCASRCIYCGFYSTTLLSLRQCYVDALCHELELRKDFLPTPHSLFSSIYLGGGTPSLLTPEQLHQLFAYINKVERGARSEEHISQDGREITMECNPDDLTADYVAALAQLPINRISMGAQTFSDKRLRFLHRRHSAADVPVAVDRLRAAGFRNISIDLMFGFPDETLAEWCADIDAVVALRPEHISAYSLMYEEGTLLCKMMAEGLAANGERLTPLKEETERRMYDILIDRLTAAGYEHYEISNFAKTIEGREAKGKGRQSFRSIHNSSYWHDEPYLGIGAAAHSYFVESQESRAEGQKPRGARYRSWNIADIQQYVESIEKGGVPSERENIDGDTHYNDLVTTALRTREGISLSALEPKYRDYLMKNAQQSLRNGLLSIDNDQIHLTRQGLFVSDDVMSDLIYL